MRSRHGSLGAVDDPGAFEVAAVPASATFELRRDVLRPGAPLGAMALSDDDEPGTGTYAAVRASGEVLGTARVARAEPSTERGDGLPEGARWQLRAMATRADVRGLGIGTAVLARVVRHVEEHGGGLLWCNARLGALGFYRRAGFVPHGEPFELPGIGPHVVMSVLVPAAPDVTGPRPPPAPSRPLLHGPLDDDR